MRTRLHSALAFALVVIPSIAAAQEAVTVTGRVTGENGEPLQGATVTASGTTRVAVTRDDGSYRLVLPPGRYELRARLLGYTAARESVTVVGRESVTRDFRLARA